MTYNNATDSRVTQYNVIVGGAKNRLANVAPSSTTGVPLISQGASSNPAFGVASIAGGGTNASSFTQTNGIVTYNGTSLVNYAGPQISSSGTYTNTTQPMCAVLLSSNQSNVTGDGTGYTILFDDTTLNVGNHYNPSTGVFTFPVTGSYQVNAGVEVTNSSGGTYAALTANVDSGSMYVYGTSLPAAAAAPTGYYLTMGALFYVPAAGQFFLTVAVFGGTLSSTVNGESNLRTFLSVTLLD